MEDDTETQESQPLWINWADQIISFHAEVGYQQLEFSSKEEKMEYVFEKTSQGFRIQ